MSDIRKLLAGIKEWRSSTPESRPVAAAPPTAPQPAAALPTVMEDAVLAKSLDALVGAAVQATNAAAGTALPALPAPITGYPALTTLHRELQGACARSLTLPDTCPDYKELSGELAKHGYPKDFLEREVLPLLKPNRPGLTYRVLRVEPGRVVVITSTGAEQSLYRPDHNPGLGG